MKTYYYAHGGNGAIMVCSDGRYVDTVEGCYNDAIGDRYDMVTTQALMDKIWDEIGSFYVENDTELEDSALELVPFDISDDSDTPREAICRYVGATFHTEEK